MQLKIEVIQYKGRQLLEQRSVNFDINGGTIGRLHSSSLFLNDQEPTISSQHATIKFENGFFYLHDHSSNGTLVNDNKIHGSEVKLMDGDQLKVGAYLLEIGITGISDNPAHVQVSDILDNGFVTTKDIDKVELVSPPFDFSPGQSDDEESSGVVAPDETLNDESSPSSIISPQKEKRIAKSNQKSFIIPPDFNPENLLPSSKKKPISSSEMPNSDKNSDKISDFSEEPLPLDDAKSSGKAATKDVMTAKKKAEKGNNEFIEIFLDALGIVDEKGIKDEEATEFIKTLGTVFRKLIDGLRTMLEERSMGKSEIYAEETMMNQNWNNPLKFSSTTTDAALKFMLIDKHEGFMDAATAIEESYKDVAKHQLCMTTAAQAILDKLLERLEPKQFEEKYKNPITKKSKCWDAYYKAYKGIVNEIDTLFDEEFANAYENSMSEIPNNGERQN
ncbi:type VI secretion system-associated FHA domain protein TagH [Desulfobacterales bacterium HSG16]|nr:type VI secretion system-associated FHA domain protein TagH [Desulfobacterales bacterium HSG16]